MIILFEDENLVAVEKPAGWLSVPSTQGKSDPRPVVGIELQNQLKTTLFPLHRLDLEVGGVLAFAKNSQTQKKISELWNSGKVQKTYHALTLEQNFSHWPENVSGKLNEAPKESPWVSYLVAGKRRAFVASHGQKSVTNWKILEQKLNSIQWELEPVTGRRHQLRLELSRRGFPILGDRLYGSSVSGPENEIALKAVRLQIPGYKLIQTSKGLLESWNSES